MSDLNYVYLPKDKDFVYCFLREQVLLEEDCDYYEHNLECDKNGDVFGRTHRKGSLAGYTYQDVSGSVLNSCKYCVENAKQTKKYLLPQDAEVNKNKSFLSRIMNKLREKE